MKKFALYVSILVLSAFTVQQPALTRDDKSFLLDQLQSTKATLLNDVSGLSDAQMQFKPAPGRWSVSECMEHIIMVEKAIFAQEQASMKQAPNPEKRSEIKVTDSVLIKMMGDRSHKAQAAEEMKPKGTYTSSSAAVEAFTTQRDQIIDYVKGTNDDMRSHVIPSPRGYMDAYQYMLIVAGHCGRHTQQIEEVKNDPAFPRSN